MSFMRRSWVLFFSYSFSSHLIHYDYNGLILRNMPVLHASDDDSVDYDIAQALKILSNTLSFYLFRVVGMLRGTNVGMVKQNK